MSAIRMLFDEGEDPVLGWEVEDAEDDDEVWLGLKLRRRVLNVPRLVSIVRGCDEAEARELVASGAVRIIRNDALVDEVSLRAVRATGDEFLNVTGWKGFTVNVRPSGGANVTVSIDEDRPACPLGLCSGGAEWTDEHGEPCLHVDYEPWGGWNRESIESILACWNAPSHPVDEDCSWCGADGWAWICTDCGVSLDDHVDSDDSHEAEVPFA